MSEIWHGCHRASPQVRQGRLNFVRELEALLPVLPFGIREALDHAEITAALAKIGQPIGNNDSIIAATARSNNHSVVTLNEEEFQKVPDLRLISVRQFLAR